MGARFFYCVDEFTNVEKYCRRKGLKPYKTISKFLDGCPFSAVVQYTKGGYVYDVLEYSQCYSGYMVTLMRLPKLLFTELLELAMTSRHADEREGAIGMILKDHEREFEVFLTALCDRDISDKREKKRVVRVARFILGYVREHTSYVQDMEKVLDLCQQISTL